MSQMYQTYSYSKEPTFVFSHGECDIYGGGQDAPFEAPHGEWKLVVNLTPIAPKEISIKAFHGAEHVVGAELCNVVTPPTLQVPTQDMCPPPVSRRWWLALGDKLRSIKGDVLFHCKGGIGRTGTALTALVGLLPEHDLADLLEPNETPLDFVRYMYDDMAVETNVQVAYLRTLGIAVSPDAVGSNSFPRAEPKKATTPSPKVPSAAGTDEEYAQWWRSRIDEIIDDEERPGADALDQDVVQYDDTKPYSQN